MIKAILLYFDDLLKSTIIAGWILLFVSMIFLSCGIYGIYWRVQNIPDIPLEPTREQAVQQMQNEKAYSDCDRLNKIEENLKNEYLAQKRNYEPKIENCKQHSIYYVSGMVWFMFLFLGVVVFIWSMFVIRCP